VPGYREEESVDPNSNTETYACVKVLHRQLALGRRSVLPAQRQALARKHSEIAVKFRGIPHRIFGEAGDRSRTTRW
jgi:glucose-6-phosphate 1-dehydrogenase